MYNIFTIEFTNERIIPSGGLAVVGAILGKDRVNLLSVGESQRVPALDLSRLDFLKFTSSLCLLSNVTYSLPDCQLLSDFDTGDGCLHLLQIHSVAVMLSMKQLLQISSGKFRLCILCSCCF